jgi:hypothetical protein
MAGTSRRAQTFFEHHFAAEFGPVEDVAVDGYRYRPFTIAGFSLELLEPYDPTSPVARFLDRRGRASTSCPSWSTTSTPPRPPCGPRA